ncbi:hypothetical protein BV20DRAFT_1036888 [Pilatotrama ljubarskyi]|nr:hypothetical protein BV20DRAFT_1036888 [Pilatotrama ljubarskyi]
MRFTISAVTLAALAPMVLGQGPRINTLMSPTQCEPVQFTWEGGSPPYYLSLVPGGQPGAQAMKQFPAQNGTSMTWTVDLPDGTRLQVNCIAHTCRSSSLRDGSGTQAFSDIQTVQPGPDSSCLNDSVSETTAMTMAATSTSGATDTSAASTNTATTTSVPAVAQKAISTSASGSPTLSGTAVHAASSGASLTSSTATSSNAASLHTSAGAIGIAGLLGLVGAALLG